MIAATDHSRAPQAGSQGDRRPILVIPYMWIGDFVRCHSTVRVLRQRFPDRPVDILATPLTAPEIAPLDADDKLFHEVNLRTLRNTMLGNNLRLCGLAIPNGRDNRNLPTSILFSAPHGEDRRLLGLGLEIERIVGGMFEPLSVAA